MRYSTTSRVPYTPVTPQGPPHKIDSHFGEHYDIHGSTPFEGSGLQLSRIVKKNRLTCRGRRYYLSSMGGPSLPPPPLYSKTDLHVEADYDLRDGWGLGG